MLHDNFNDVWYLIVVARNIHLTPGEHPPGYLPAVSDAQDYQGMAKRSPNVSGYGSK